MKREVLFIVVVFAVLFLVGCVENMGWEVVAGDDPVALVGQGGRQGGDKIFVCGDPDGENPFVASETSLTRIKGDDVRVETFDDECRGNKVREYRCEDNKVQRRDFRCDLGCVNGACVSPELSACEALVEQRGNVCKGSSIRLEYSCQETISYRDTFIVPVETPIGGHEYRFKYRGSDVCGEPGAKIKFVDETLGQTMEYGLDSTGKITMRYFGDSIDIEVVDCAQYRSDIVVTSRPFAVEEEVRCDGGDCGECTSWLDASPIPGGLRGCTDTEEGIDYYTNGVVAGTWTDGDETTGQQDVCGGNILNEYYCEEDNFYIATKIYECPNGCVDGACVGAPITPPAPPDDVTPPGNVSNESASPPPVPGGIVTNVTNSSQDDSPSAPPLPDVGGNSTSGNTTNTTG